MRATIVDLKYHMNKVLGALKRNEEITVLYRGQKIAKLTPIREQKKMLVTAHPFFNMFENDEKSVTTQMKELRGGRYRDI